MSADSRLSFMEEGIDQDDKYRMVEDEFLSIAQQFTVHLHAAEYKRQQKMVKVRNAEAINSISRPVTGKMPNHTKRRVEGVAKAKAQRTVLQTLLGEKPGEEESSDDSDGDGLPYVGTTLHGLMDSPRGKSASLSKIRASNVATRAAAGFGKPVQRSSQISPSVSPASKVASRLSLPKVEYDGSTESSDDDDDDDLDAPVASRNLSSFNRKANLVPTAMDISRSAVTVIESSRSSTSTTQLSMENSSYSKVTTAVAPPKPVPTSSETARIDMESKARLARRLEIAKLRKAKQEQEEKKKPTAVIPTFL